MLQSPATLSLYEEQLDRERRYLDKLAEELDRAEREYVDAIQAKADSLAAYTNAERAYQAAEAALETAKQPLQSADTPWSEAKTYVRPFEGAVDSAKKAVEESERAIDEKNRREAANAAVFSAEVEVYSAQNAVNATQAAVGSADPNSEGYADLLEALKKAQSTQEIMALEPKHIEEDGSCIHIRQAVTMVKGSPKIGPPKTKTSYRDIPVPSHLREIAKEFRNTSEQFIWHGEDVPICNPSVFRKHFKKALIAAGKVRLLSPHCCRHTYASQLQAQGVPLETIQSLTGHADVDMTEHYLHVQKEVKEDAAQKLDSLFKKGKPTLHIA